jgi:hypothetical protein
VGAPAPGRGVTSGSIAHRMLGSPNCLCSRGQRHELASAIAAGGRPLEYRVRSPPLRLTAPQRQDRHHCCRCQRSAEGRRLRCGGVLPEASLPNGTCGPAVQSWPFRWAPAWSAAWFRGQPGCPIARLRSCATSRQLRDNVARVLQLTATRVSACAEASGACQSAVLDDEINYQISYSQ